MDASVALVSRSSVTRLIFLAAMYGLACGGVVENGEGARGQGGATATLWDDTPASEIPSPDALCAAGPGTPVKHCSDSSFKQLLIGRWWQCTGWSPFAPSPVDNGVGVEFTDGKWYALAKSTNGDVVRAPGAQGTWSAYHNAEGDCVGQMDLYNGGILTWPQFYDNPRRLQLNAGGDGGDPGYVAIP